MFEIDIFFFFLVQSGLSREVIQMSTKIATVLIQWLLKYWLQKFLRKHWTSVFQLNDLTSSSVESTNLEKKAKWTALQCHEVWSTISKTFVAAQWVSETL